MTSQFSRNLMAGTAACLLLAGASGANAAVIDHIVDLNPSLFIFEDQSGQTGVMSTTTIGGPDFTIENVKIDVHITHTWIGDLRIEVEHLGTTVVLFRHGCGDLDNIHAVWADGGQIDSDAECAALTVLGPNALTDPAQQADPNSTNTNYFDDKLSDFNGFNAVGDWTLKVVDIGAGDEGTLDGWSIHLTGLCDCNPEPEPEPEHNSSIPEPATMALFGFGLAGLGLIRRRRAA